MCFSSLPWQCSEFCDTSLNWQQTDFVGEILGGNRVQNGQIGPWGRITGMTHIFQLFGNDSPHSTYRCEEHANARCGDKP